MLHKGSYINHNRITTHLATTSILCRSSADILWGSSFLMSTKSSSTDWVQEEKEKLNSCMQTYKKGCSNRLGTRNRYHTSWNSTHCKYKSLSHLCHFIWDTVVEQPSHTQVDSELVELWWGLRKHVHGAEILLQVGWSDLSLQVYLTVRLWR